MLLCMVLLCVPCLHAQRLPMPAAHPSELTVTDSEFFSAALQRQMRYRVIFPAEYAKGGRFPVLYLLHGLYGDYKNWDTRTTSRATFVTQISSS